MASFEMTSHHEDWDEESEESDESALYEDRSTLCRANQAMGYNRDYVREWGPQEAFREFTQNW